MSTIDLRRASLRAAQRRVSRSLVLRQNNRRRVGFLSTATNMAVFCAGICTAACGSDTAPKPSAAQAESAAAVARAAAVISADTAGRTLASAGGAATYHVDETEGARGTIHGDVTMLGALPLDTTVVPDRDSTGCRPFQDVTFPLARGARTTKNDSSAHQIGNAVVWLMGVTHGPRDVMPRRINLVLDDCHLEPRVMVAPLGATLNISNRDDMIVKLKFADLGRMNSPRATVGFTDPGQIVPTVAPLATPGLVEIVDEKHPWVRGFIAVAPHPFVAVTEADGVFEFEGVPAGSYTLVVWHERLGARVLAAKVEAGGTTPVTVKF